MRKIKFLGLDMEQEYLKNLYNITSLIIKTKK